MEGPRKEIDFTLGGKKYSVAPTFKTLVAIERQRGEACQTLARRVLNGDASIDEIAAILTTLIAAVDPKGPDFSDVGDMLFDEGTRNFVVPLGKFLSRALIGNAEFMKGEKPSDGAGGDAPLGEQPASETSSKGG